MAKIIGSNLEFVEQSAKSVEQAREQSLQARATGEGMGFGAGGFLMFLHNAGELIAPWWSRKRDADLDAFWKQSDHLSSTLGTLTAKVITVPPRILPRDASVKRHIAQAEEYNIRLFEETEFGETWVQGLSKWLADFWLADNGGFWEVIGPSKSSKCLWYDLGGRRALVWDRKTVGQTAAERRDRGETAGPVVGPAVGLAHLDSRRCTRTGDPEYPVRYLDTDGDLFRYHRTRVAYAADLPSPRAEMHGVGFCAASRTVNNAQHLVDIGIYKQEKLGSRPRRAIIVAKKVRGELIQGVFRDADEIMDNQGLRRFSKIPYLADLPADAVIELLDLASLPDGFNDETSTRLGMFAMANAFGVPIRWIWPAAVTGATKADAMYQHISGLGGGLGRVFRTLEVTLGGDPRGARHSAGKFLPPHLKLVFDMQDDEQDRMRAEIQKQRAETRKTDLADSVVTLRVSREQALEAGDVTRAQFEDMELNEGRLPDGSPVLSLFASTDDTLLRLLDLGVTEPLAVNANDPLDMMLEIDAAGLQAQDLLTNATGVGEKTKARQAMAALGALKALYAPLLSEQATAETAVEVEAGEEPETTARQPAEAQKQFNWGIPFGIIHGQLARGPGGQFISAAELQARARQRIAGKLAGRTGDMALSKAALKRQDNREEVAEKLGVPADLLHALLAMRSGEPADENMLLEERMAYRMPDGTLVLRQSARSLLSAANSGDVDKAREMLSKVRTEPTSVEKEQQREAERAAEEAERVRKRQEAETERERREAEAEAAREAELREREEAERRELESNRTKIAEKLPDVDTGKLRIFGEGEDIPKEKARLLAAQGLVEIGKDGEPRLTSAGRSVLRASDSGDVRTAKDALSKAKESVADTLKKAEERQSKAEDLGRQAEERDGLAEQLADRIARTEDADEVERLKTQLEATREQAGQLRERAAEENAEAETLRESVGGTQKKKGFLATLAGKFVRHRAGGDGQARRPEPEDDGTSHKALRVDSRCPLPDCGGLEADLYPGHKGLLVCRECGRTYDPEVEP